jgi:hypothetical protein
MFIPTFIGLIKIWFEKIIGSFFLLSLFLLNLRFFYFSFLRLLWQNIPFVFLYFCYLLYCLIFHLLLGNLFVRNLWRKHHHFLNFWPWGLMPTSVVLKSSLIKCTCTVHICLLHLIRYRRAHPQQLILFGLNKTQKLEGVPKIDS